MRQSGTVLPFGEDPDPTDRLPALEDHDGREDTLEQTGTWIGPVEHEVAEARSGAVERQLQELQREHASLVAEYAEMRSTIAHLENQLSESREKEEALKRELELEREARSRLEAGSSGAELLAAATGEGPAPVPGLQRCLARLDADEELTFPLFQPRTRIGRTPENELQLHEGYISRSHAVIKLTAREAIVEDLGSRNGVFVNDRRISRQLLREGDVVTFGKARFRLQHSTPTNT